MTANTFTTLQGIFKNKNADAKPQTKKGLKPKGTMFKRLKEKGYLK